MFDPVYEWSRDKRKLNEQGRYSETPDLPEIAFHWLSVFEFFTYGMHAGGKNEARRLMEDIIAEGMERGARSYQLQNQQFYQAVGADAAIDYGDRMLVTTYLRSMEQELAEDPNEIAEQVLKWYRERRIPYQTAVDWIERYVTTPS